MGEHEEADDPVNDKAARPEEQQDVLAQLDSKYHFSPKILAAMTCRRYARCGTSICTVCAERKAKKHSSKIGRILATTHSFNAHFDHPIRLYRLVLTLRAEPSPLKPSIRRLYSSFLTMRKENAYWRSNVYGGCFRLHVGYSHVERHWTPHFDCVIEGKALKQPRVQEAWHSITGDSHIIKMQDVRLTPRSFEKLSNYVLKVPFWDFQITSRSSVDELNTHVPLLMEYDQAVFMKRKFDTFGAWRRRPRRRPLPKVE